MGAANNIRLLYSLWERRTKAYIGSVGLLIDTHNVAASAVLEHYLHSILSHQSPHIEAVIAYRRQERHLDTAVRALRCREGLHQERLASDLVTHFAQIGTLLRKVGSRESVCLCLKVALLQDDEVLLLGSHLPQSHPGTKEENRVALIREVRLDAAPSIPQEFNAIREDTV